MKNKSPEDTNLRHKLKETTRLGWWQVDGGKEKNKPGVKKEKRKEKSFPAPQPGERRSVSIFPTRRKKECFTDHRALEKSKETRGEKKEGGDLKRLFFFLPHTLSLSPSLPLTLSLTLTHNTHTPSSPLSIPLLMAIKGAENKKKKKRQQQQLILNRLNQ